MKLKIVDGSDTDNLHAALEGMRFWRNPLPSTWPLSLIFVEGTTGKAPAVPSPPPRHEMRSPADEAVEPAETPFRSPDGPVDRPSLGIEQDGRREPEDTEVLEYFVAAEDIRVGDPLRLEQLGDFFGGRVNRNPEYHEVSG